MLWRSSCPSGSVGLELLLECLLQRRCCDGRQHNLIWLSGFRFILVIMPPKWALERLQDGA